MRNDRTAPERPRVEPEIIPPDRTRSARRGPNVEMDGAHRIYVTRVSPVGGILLMLVVAVFIAVGGLLLFGALLISIPLVAVLIIIGAIAGLLRSRRW